jgi:hypothetical protein
MTTSQSTKTEVLSLLHGNLFWVSVLLVAALSVGCFGYAGIQLRSTDSAPTPQQNNDGVETTKKLRSPILFERTVPAGPTITSS